MKSLAVMVIVVAAAVAITKSYFADNGVVQGSTVSGGTIDLRLANAGGSYGNNVTGTWSSPESLKPGDKFGATLYMKNVGSEDIHWVYLDFKDIVPGSGSTSSGEATEFAKQVIITSMKDSLDGYTADYIDNFSVYDRNDDSKISIWELVNGDAKYPSNNTPSDIRLWNGDTGGNWRINHPMLPANSGATYGFKMEFEFMDKGDQSSLMNKSFKFDVDAMGTTSEVVNVSGASSTTITES